MRTLRAAERVHSETVLLIAESELCDGDSTPTVVRDLDSAALLEPSLLRG